MELYKASQMSLLKNFHLQFVFLYEYGIYSTLADVLPSFTCDKETLEPKVDKVHASSYKYKISHVHTCLSCYWSDTLLTYRLHISMFKRYLM